MSASSSFDWDLFGKLVDYRLSKLFSCEELKEISSWWSSSQFKNLKCAMKFFHKNDNRVCTTKMAFICENIKSISDLDPKKVYEELKLKIKSKKFAFFINFIFFISGLKTDETRNVGTEIESILGNTGMAYFIEYDDEINTYYRSLCKFIHILSDRFGMIEIDLGNLGKLRLDKYREFWEIFLNNCQEFWWDVDKLIEEIVRNFSNIDRADKLTKQILVFLIESVVNSNHERRKELLKSLLPFKGIDEYKEIYNFLIEKILPEFERHYIFHKVFDYWYKFSREFEYYCNELKKLSNDLGGNFDYICQKNEGYIDELDKLMKSFRVQIQNEIQRIFSFSKDTDKSFVKSLEAISGTLKNNEYFISSEVLGVFHKAVHIPPRFIILMGPPGTGKTSLAVLYAGAYYGITGWGSIRSRVDEILKTNDKVLLVRVKPNWHDSSDILGYVDIHGNFRKGLIYNFLKRASEDRENLYFLILDEMNLSHPEHYLSDIISAMESGGYIEIPNTDERIPYPHNLVIIGTVNLDETTKNLSPRLLSRAVTITMRTNWDLITDDVSLGAGKSLKELFRKIDEALSKANLGIGYREYVRAKEFIENEDDDIEKLKLLDAYLKSKIVPRIRGTREIFELRTDGQYGKSILDDIIKTLREYNLEETAKALEVKKAILENQGYVE